MCSQTGRGRLENRIFRSSTRARMCSQTGRGRLENRIFGNCVFPENGPDQILTRLAFALGIGLSHETAISRIEILPRCSFSLHSALRERNQCPAHRQMLFLATRSTSIASSAGMVTLSGGWTMTFEYVPLRDFSCPYDIKRTSLVHFAARKKTILHPSQRRRQATEERWPAPPVLQ